jgi:hypothetical protein
VGTYRLTLHFSSHEKTAPDMPERFFLIDSGV